MLGKMPLQIILRILLNAGMQKNGAYFLVVSSERPDKKGNVIKWFEHATDIQNINSKTVESNSLGKC
jgi:hypothetical protein